MQNMFPLEENIEMFMLLWYIARREMPFRLTKVAS